MKVLIIGAGSIGIALGAIMKNNNTDIDFLTHGETYKSIKDNGISIEGLLGERYIDKEEIGIYSSYEDMEENVYDYIIICTKTTVNREVSEEVFKNRRILKSSGIIVIMQNGWGNDESYLKYFPKEKIYSARVITGFERTKRNRSKITVHAAPLMIGSLYGLDVSKVEPLVNVINEGGLESVASNDVSKALWSKMLYNCSLNPLGAIFKVNYGKLSESSYSKDIMNNIIHEIFEVMNAAGYTSFYENEEEYKKDFYDNLIPSTYNHRASTLQDMEKGIKTEMDSLNGSVIKIGEKYNIDISTNKTIYNIIKFMEINK